MIIAMNASSLTALVLILHAIATSALPTQNAATNFQSFRDEPIEMEEAFLRHLDGLGEKLKEERMHVENVRHRLKEIGEKHSKGIAAETEQNWKNLYFPERYREQNNGFKKANRRLPEYISLDGLRLETRQDSIGGGNLIRRQDSIGGGNLVRRQDSIGGGNIVRRQDSIWGGNLVRRQDSIGGGNLVRRQDSIGGGNLVRRQDSIGGGNILKDSNLEMYLLDELNDGRQENFVRRQDSIGGGNIVRRQDSIGGGNIIKRQDSIGGGNLVRRQDSIGGGHLVRRQDSIGGGNLPTYDNIEMELLEDLGRNQDEIADKGRII